MTENEKILTAEVERLNKRIATLAVGFGVPDGGRYLADWDARIAKFKALVGEGGRVSDFPDDDLIQRCKEMIEWGKTGLLNGGSGGAVRKLAEAWKEKAGEFNALNIAESETKDDAMKALIRLAAFSSPIPAPKAGASLLVEIERALLDDDHFGGAVHSQDVLGEYARASAAAIAHRLAAFVASPVEWQDIASAPKDGSKVDLLFPYPHGRTNGCAWREGGVYGAGNWYWAKPTWQSQPGLGIDWHLLPETEWEVCSYPNEQPTHWVRPLPDPVAPVSVAA
jgi:hypothetical protein